MGMTMTIEEAHRILSNGLVNAPSEYEWCVAFKLAIDTMEKYQKIEQIRHRVKHTDLEPAKAYELINEVIEDGKID